MSEHFYLSLLDVKGANSLSFAWSFGIICQCFTLRVTLTVIG
jgi:hypothetical protein